MSTPEHNRRIDYIEFKATNIAATKQFYSQAFGWPFEEWGPDYLSFNDGRMAGGFTLEQGHAPVSGGALVVLYATDLEAMEKAVRDAGGRIVREAFSFPGGRRFHFADPNGNELAVWSER
jgi:predicted enzyme related to lactoylglutathione lyase